MTLVVDTHAHVAVPAVEELTGTNSAQAARAAANAERLQGRESARVTAEMTTGIMPLMVRTDERLAAMDAAGVDIQVVSVTPAQYHPWASAGLARQIVEATHAGVLAQCAPRPERLIGLGVIPLQHPDLAVWALEDAMTRCGFPGVELATYVPGPEPIDFSDERLEPLWQRAEQLDALLFVHPMGTTIDHRLAQWNLANTIGQPLEHAIALSHLIFGGVLDRHPGLRLLFAHGGGYLPGFIGRSDHAWRVRPDAHGCAQLPSSYLKRVSFDSLVHDTRVLRSLVDTVGAERVLLGSDFPYDMAQPDPAAWLRGAGLTAAELDAVLGGNARRLGLVPAIFSPQEEM